MTIDHMKIRKKKQEQNQKRKNGGWIEDNLILESNRQKIGESLFILSKTEFIFSFLVLFLFFLSIFHLINCHINLSVYFVIESILKSRPWFHSGPDFEDKEESLVGRLM